MAIKITREEYEKKFGKAPTATPVVKKEPIKITRAEYEAKFGKPNANPYSEVPVLGQLSNIGIGIGSSIGKAGLGLGQAALKGVGALGDVISKGTAKNYTQPLVENIESIKNKVYQEPFKKELGTTSGKVGEFIGTASTYLAPSSQITKAQQGVTNLVSKIPANTNLAKAGVGVLGVAGRAVPEAIGAGATGYAISGGDIDRAKTDAFLAGAFSGGLGLVGSASRGLKNVGASKAILSKTTGIPRTAFDAVDGVGIDKGATPEKALEKGREAVKLLRAKNTKMWQDSVPKIVETYKGQRFSLNNNQAKKIIDIANEFGLEPSAIPQNMKNVSALESINLMKGLNELDSLSVKLSPKGAVVRGLKKELRDTIIDSFGGEKSEIGKLWKDYSLKSEILSNMDNIVATYKTKPTQTVTAKNRLMAIFDENKPEFLKAVKDIEEELGINLTRQIASTKFQTILPQGTLKAVGGLPTKAGVIDTVIRSLLLPVTSPKLAGKLAISGQGRTAGELEKRLLGNYRPATQNIKAPIQTSATIPSNVNNIVDNITPQSNTLPQKSTGVINTIKDKIKNTPNKQGGFIKLPQGKSEQSGLSAKSSLPKNNTDLITEAKKYKSAEEFVKAMSRSKDGLSSGKYGASKLNPTEVGSMAVSDILKGKSGDFTTGFDKLRLSNQELGFRMKVKAEEGIKFAKNGNDFTTKVYRLVPEGGTILPGDYIFLNKNSAEKFLKDYGIKRGQTKLVTKDNVSSKDLLLPDIASRLERSDSKYNYDEFIYAPKDLEGTSLEQIWKEANTTLPKQKTFIGEVTPSYKPAPLTTKLLRKLEGKTTVSKQFISDLTNSPDLKQVEKDLIRAKLEGKGDKINVADFGKEVEAELLPLKRKSSIPSEVDTSDVDSYLIAKDKYKGRYATKYETITLPDDIRGNVKDYAENIYESPIKTSAGNTHFGNMTDNYFGHTRIEDMADNKTRRVIEVQSDLYQKGNLEKEFFDRDARDMKKYTENYPDSPATPGYKEKYTETQSKLQKEKGKLQQYNNPTAHFRMVREEIQKASKDGKTKLQFPTGETAMKIEGLGQGDLWHLGYNQERGGGIRLTPDALKIGEEVVQGSDKWIITDVLGDGKFKAVPKNIYEKADEAVKLKMRGNSDPNYSFTHENVPNFISSQETFDISGKVDTNNPIYKFYNKELQNYLKNNFKAQQVVDEQGVSWLEVPVKKEYKDIPIEAFGIVGALGAGSLMSDE